VLHIPVINVPRIVENAARELLLGLRYSLRLVQGAVTVDDLQQRDESKRKTVTIQRVSSHGFSAAIFGDAFRKPFKLEQRAANSRQQERSRCHRGSGHSRQRFRSRYVKYPSSRLAASASHAVSTAKLHILQLEPIKEKLGDRWSRLSDLVHKLFEKTLKHAQGQGDHFIQSGELSYIVTFRELAPEEAGLVCEAVAREVCKLLFGDGVDTVGQLKGEMQRGQVAAEPNPRRRDTEH